MRKGWALAFGLMASSGALGDAPAEAPSSAQANVRIALARIHEIDGKLHSIIAVDPTAMNQARSIDARNARGMLAGQPVLLKDNIESQGPLPTTAGSLALLNNVTHRDAPLVKRLRGAGAVILGKTNLSEWANIRSSHSISGWSAVGGQTHNPWALDRNSCGSSSGSAVAVAAGIARFAIGTETDGSITCPGSVNGIVALKPTLGLVSRTNIVPISHSQDTAGPMADNVRDVAKLLTVIAGSDPLDPATIDADKHKKDYVLTLDPGALRGKRIGVMRFASGFGTDVPFERSLAILRKRGAILVEIPTFDASGIGRNETLVLMTELKVDLGNYLKNSPAPIAERSLADLISFDRSHAEQELLLFKQEEFEKAEATRGLSDPAYRSAREASFLAAGPNGIDRLLKTYRVAALVGPTMAPAWKINSVNGDQIPGGGAGSLAAVAGYPHLTVPMGLVGGLPVGLSFIGPRWSEPQLLSFGYAFEQARGPFPKPRFYRSIEEGDPEIERALEPAPH